MHTRDVRFPYLIFRISVLFRFLFRARFFSFRILTYKTIIRGGCPAGKHGNAEKDTEKTPFRDSGERKKV